MSVVLLREFNGNVLAVCWRSHTNIYSYIQDSSFDDPHQFALCIGGLLKMQSSHHSVGGLTFIVLYEMDVADVAVEISLGEGFEKITSSILKQTGFNDYDSLNGSWDDFHGLSLIIQLIYYFEQVLSILVLQHRFCK